VRKWIPNSYVERQNFIPDAKSVISKNLRAVDRDRPYLSVSRILERYPIGSLKVQNL